MTELTQEIVRELLDYDPDTGALTWKARDQKWFKNGQACKSWNTKYPGKYAFSVKTKKNYLRGKILGHPCLAHRIIWFWMIGSWPNQIDHINGVRDDNRWINLRNVTNQENCKNRALSKRNKSGVIGVYWNRQTLKWRTEIVVNQKIIVLGNFSELSSAAAIRKAAEKKYGYHENHGRES